MNDKRKGFSEWLLIDALRKLLAASESVAFPVIIVDAKDGAKHLKTLLLPRVKNLNISSVRIPIWMELYLSD